ncbi:SRPBCC domain-containing protein [Endozoicomonas sp. G2_1]|uniref:SRPBCC domain-containing protein n=1 Tax=Endozoicomonas sp. G2_1 TaxID=2821091 RepID=UPI001ADCF1CE|nr:SRPBCC domain-containing protein [Endozoicomonas sp. G2_1]MBO9489811.1 SRPBCC domain-containing protein [Endozoicomonas sp. G2_1]
MAQISKEFMIDASSDAVYKALTEASEFEKFTGMPVKIDLSPGGEASLFNGYIKGYFIEFKKSERLIMAWKDCYNWEDGEYSILNLTFTQINSKTRLCWYQEGIPEREVAHLEDGLERKYINPLQEYLSSGQVISSPVPDTCQIT